MIRLLLLGSCALIATDSANAQSSPASAGQRDEVAVTQAPGPSPFVAKPSAIEPVRRYRAKPPTPPMVRVRAATQAAIHEPSAPGFVNAIQVYPFSDGVLYRVYAAPERVTDIMLQPGEAIVAVAAGDTVRWTVGDTASGSGDTKRVHILVKPFAPGLSTNLIITTDRRAYHLQLESNAAIAMAALSWTYPQDELLAIRRVAEAERKAAPIANSLILDQLNFGYAITGDKPSWRPLRAFDDGRQSYIEFPANVAVGEAPPLFVIGDDGKAALVNYRMSGRFYVIDRLFDAAELRLGGKRQSIVRITRGDGRRESKWSAS